MARMKATRVERLRSPQIRDVQELIRATANTNTAYAYLLRYCLYANACAFVALAADQRVVGFIGGTLSESVAMIECLCVDCAFRNMGVATSLIDRFVQEAPATSVCKLDVRLSNTLARQFYMRRGFVEASTKELFYHDEDALTMTRPVACVVTQTTV